MLAVSTAAQLALFAPSSLKLDQPSPENATILEEKPSACVWAPDNSLLFLASSHHIHKYDPSASSLTRIHSHNEEITAITLIPANNTLVYSAGLTICWFVSSSGQASPPAPLSTTHKDPIKSLSLSTDSSLLASASTSSVHVHNLSVSSTTPLRGLIQPISCCMFHPHTRTRLLVASERQLMVYDTTRPSSPGKKIPMSEAVQGEICAIACSPFSKSLVAVATLGGSVAMIDLDKEKGLFKTLHVHAPLTSLTFSPDGANIYLGTETGQLFIIDLRALDKQPKSVVIENGARVQCMAVQKKRKTLEATTPTPITTATARRMPSKGSVRADMAALGKKPAVKSSSPAPRKASKSSVRVSPLASPASTKSISHKSDISVDLEAFDTAHKPTVIRKQPSSSGSPTLTARQSAPKLERAASSASSRPAGSSSGTRQGVRISSSRSSGSLRPKSPMPISSISTRPKLSTRPIRTPSPDLPGIDEPVTPMNLPKKRVVSTASAVQVVGEHPPDSRKGKAKTVEFDGINHEAGEKELKIMSPWDQEKENEFQYVARHQQQQSHLQPHHATTDMQISPRRPGLAASSVPSPLRPFTTSASNGSAQDLLRSLVSDVMYEHQQETKAELMGLHLDLIRAGRSWKQELREIMDEYMSDLRELREENVRLRKENEMLRRGY